MLSSVIRFGCLTGIFENTLGNVALARSVLGHVPQPCWAIVSVKRSPIYVCGRR
jgi:hypothetical protein